MADTLFVQDRDRATYEYKLLSPDSMLERHLGICAVCPDRITNDQTAVEAACLHTAHRDCVARYFGDHELRLCPAENCDNMLQSPPFGAQYVDVQPPASAVYCWCNLDEYHGRVIELGCGHQACPSCLFEWLRCSDGVLHYLASGNLEEYCNMKCPHCRQKADTLLLVKLEEEEHKCICTKPSISEPALDASNPHDARLMSLSQANDDLDASFDVLKAWLETKLGRTGRYALMTKSVYEQPHAIHNLIVVELRYELQTASGPSHTYWVSIRCNVRI